MAEVARSHGPAEGPFFLPSRRASYQTEVSHLPITAR